MRIGGNIIKAYSNPDEWLTCVKDLGYSTVLSPVPKEGTTKNEIEAYLTCARENDITIGEVGVWNNPMSLDDQEREQAIAYCIERLKLADQLGANCCVNIAGARGAVWSGIYLENYSEATYDLLVQTIRTIIDGAKPQTTFYTIESMPWMIPDSPEQYLELIKDVDREQFGVHLDFVNMINNPRKYADRDNFIKKCFDLLGPYIKSVHLKDIKRYEAYPCKLEECPLGEGDLDISKVLHLCEKISPDISVFVEHMSEYEDYKKAVAYVRGIALKIGVVIK